MGCDIHIATEQLTHIRDVEAWRNADLHRMDYYENKMEIEEVYHGRDYDLFAALADVRNRGLIEPLAQPRGMPADAHELTKVYTERYGCDGHSHSWCTLQELYDYQAKHPTKKQSGLISAEQAEAFDKDGELPTSWCQGTNMPGYVRREWVRPYSPVDQLIEVLERRFNYWGDNEKIEQAQAEKIRIVFFFDN